MTRPLLKLTLAVLIALGCIQAQAHESMPFYIELTETAHNQYRLNWKAPTTVPAFALPRIAMPKQCVLQSDALTANEAAFYSGQQRYRCKRSISGSQLRLFYPKAQTGLATLVRLSQLNGQQFTQRLTLRQSQWTIPKQVSSTHVTQQYIELGIHHIFGGIDHLLFVLCLMLIARTRKRIIITITGFTIAHSLSLALSVLQIIKLPSAPIEASIALSIVFLAHEISVHNTRSWTWRYPILVSSAFGLLHGLGFAAALQTIGLPQAQLGLALVGFNVGVELGQVLFISAVALLGFIVRPLIKQYWGSHKLRRSIAAYAIGIPASYWLVERLSAF